jgi:predicted ATPase
VLVSAFASSSQIITIEQPEIHLHPALQADLGDVFLQAALGEQKNRFLIESHSEHLLLRIMRRMRETANGSLPQGVPPVRPEDVAVLFVQPKGSSAAVRHLELDEEGQLLDPWPGGFFEEGYRERFA